MFSLFESVYAWIPAVAFGVMTMFNPVGVYNKCFLWARGVLFFWVSSEKRGLSKVKCLEGESAAKKKTIIFIRHGESDWNEVFNKSKVLLLPRLVRACFREILYFPSAHSVFIDSPLSKEGVDQAKSLRSFIKTAPSDPIIDSLRGSNLSGSVLVSSNLRRAINTGCIALWDRVSETKEKIILLAECQEMSRNVDTNAIAPPKAYPEMSVVEKVLGKSFDPAKVLDASQCTGNKALRSTAAPRMKAFCDWVFQRGENTVIVAGHSLWFKSFFNTYLPKSSNHISKKYKMYNCAAVSFELGQSSNGSTYGIAEESIREVYQGFKVKGKKKN